MTILKDEIQIDDTFLSIYDTEKDKFGLEEKEGDIIIDNKLGVKL